MTHQLREAFRDLAESADHVSAPGSPKGPHDLWRRGRRARRQRVAASVLVAGAVMALLGGVLPVVGGQLRTTPAPASYDEADLAVPDQIWAPISWAPTADEENPPGPLAMVARAPRRGLWPFSREHQWFGVSAVDQSYSWLDLPGQSDDVRTIALSPDGGEVAYLLGGSPPGPRTEVSDPWMASEPQSDVVGVAVLDLGSGEVVRHRVATRFGLSVDDAGLVWSQDSVSVVVTYGQYGRMLGSSSFPLSEAWRPDDGTVRALLPADFDGVESLAAGPDGTMVGWRGDRFSFISLTTAEHVERPVRRRPSVFAPGAPMFNPNGTRVAFMDGRRGGRLGATYPAVYTAPVSADREIGELAMLDKRWTPQAVLGWLDDTHLLVEAHRSDYRGVGPPLRVLLWDVETGTTAPGIGRPGSYDELDSLRVATDFLVRPLSPARWPGLGLPAWPATAALWLLLLGLVVAVVRRTRSRREERALAAGSAG